MENNHNEQSVFSYTYSAREQAELKRIREKYMLPTERKDKMARLCRLDASVTRRAEAAALVFGIVGALVFGFGIGLCMTDLSAFFGLRRATAMVLGIASGILGGTLVALAYPVYSFVTKRERERVAPEIIKLTDELMK